MSRKSSDNWQGGRLMDGYDYDRQAWVKNGKYLRCGHPEQMICGCWGRTHAGEETPRNFENEMIDRCIMLGRSFVFGGLN